MSLPIISMSERKKEKSHIKACIFGKSGIGKTSLLYTLPPEKTLFLDLEAGGLAVEDWAGDSFLVRSWEECKDIACFIGGPNPAMRDNQSYSYAHYSKVLQKYGDVEAIDKYDNIFIDSITVAGRHSFNWSKFQPQAFVEKTGKQDIRSAYGLHGQEMLGWLTQLQHVREKNIWLVGILDEKMDDFNRPYYTAQIDGSKTSLELPGIVDQVITMTELSDKKNKKYRAFICQTLNDWGYPAKDRSGRLSMIERPHLGELIKKINKQAKPIEERLNFNLQ